MKPISADIAEKILTRISSVPPEEASNLINKMGEEQPAVLAFLMASGEDIFSPKEQEIQLYLGIVIWQIMLEGDPNLPSISIETVESVEESNIRKLENLNNAPQDNVNDEALDTFRNFNQQEIFKYILEIIMEDSDRLIKEESKGIMFFNLKTVIECFDKEQ
jgi:hypothetical protein